MAKSQKANIGESEWNRVTSKTSDDLENKRQGRDDKKRRRWLLFKSRSVPFGHSGNNPLPETREGRHICSIHADPTSSLPNLAAR